MTASTVPGFSNRQLWLVLGTLMLSVLLASMEISIISTALPTIVGEFQSFESFAWVGTAYIVTSAIGTPIMGKLSDLFGRKLVFQSTLALFIVGSLLCGLAQSMGQLIAFRAVQGLGGGAIQALAFAMLGDILPPRERGRYIGYFTLAFVGAALLGPLVGGVIIDHFTWPWIFFINVPLGLIAMGVTHVALTLPFSRRRARIDWAGAALLSIGIAALMIGLEEGQEGWTQRHVLVLFAVAGCVTTMFLAVERRADEPIIPLRLFSDRAVVTATVIGMCAGTIAFGAGQFLPLYFQDSLFVSPTESGLRMLPQMIGVTAGTFGIGRLIARTGRCRPWPIIGSLIAVAGLLVISQISGSTSYATLVVPMVAMGFGMASVFTTSSIVAQNAVEFRDLGVVTSTIMFFRSLGGSLGLAVFGTILNSTIRSEIPSRLDVAPNEASDLIRSPEEIQALPLIERQAVIDSLAIGVGRIYLVCAGVMAVAFVVALVLPERPLRTRAGLSDALEERSAAGSA
ncbi:MAG: MDR family MFS transporter [Ilumatobacter sp.]|uniref:MDR family MFS transporter n=1 Tax=Ilumatobacter sp. TaxID=1967498 RepID=UPI00391C8FD3